MSSPSTAASAVPATAKPPPTPPGPLTQTQQEALRQLRAALKAAGDEGFSVLYSVRHEQFAAASLSNVETGDSETALELLCTLLKNFSDQGDFEHEVYETGGNGPMWSSEHARAFSHATLVIVSKVLADWW